MALTDIDAQRLGDSVADKLGNRNLIINGAMNVAQRNTSSTTNGYGSVDRFFIQWDGGTTTHTQTAITSGSPYDEGFRNVLRLTNTATATGAGNYRNPFQYIEAQNIAQSGWDYTSSSSYVTLSFWVRSSVAQEFYGYLRTFDGTGQLYSFSLGSLSANTWTKVTKVIPGNSNITVNNDSGSGLQVNISPFWGTDFTDSGHTTEAWASFNSGSRAPDYTNTWANTTDATFDITGLQLEVGNTATPFEHRSFGDDLVKCQRYYEKSYDYGTVPGTSTSTGLCSVNATTVTNTYRYYSVEFAVEKRGTPTITTYAQDGTTTQATNAAGTNLAANSAQAALACTKNFAVTNNRGSDITVTTNCIAFHYQADAEL